LFPAETARYPQNYLALYENADPVRMTHDHKPLFSDEMPISSAFSYANTCCAYYDMLVARNQSPGLRPAADLIVEWIEARPDEAGFVDWYANERFPALMRMPGVVSGTVGKAAVHQMPGIGPRPEFTAIYRTTNLRESLQAFNQVKAAASAPWNPADAAVGCFTPLTDRVTLTEVMEPDPASRETARRKREAMGDRKHRAPPRLGDSN
jgi:hypothetical protein